MKTTKQQIQEDIENAKALLSDAQARLDGLNEEEVWEPEGGEWYIDSWGDCREAPSTDGSSAFGIEFKTKEDAEQAALIYGFWHRLYKLACFVNPSGKPVRSHSIYPSEGGFHPTLHGCGGSFFALFENKEAAQKAVEIMERDGWEWPL